MKTFTFALLTLSATLALVSQAAPILDAPSVHKRNNPWDSAPSDVPQQEPSWEKRDVQPQQIQEPSWEKRDGQSQRIQEPSWEKRDDSALGGGFAEPPQEEPSWEKRDVQLQQIQEPSWEKRDVQPQRIQEPSWEKRDDSALGGGFAELPQEEPSWE
ncbi:hypothetical protein EC991_002524 [Linnemannia zychae]|nr:hypothetical protein EC991_002524 [Linnemannia zychae]